MHPHMQSYLISNQPFVAKVRKPRSNIRSKAKAKSTKHNEPIPNEPNGGNEMGTVFFWSEILLTWHVNSENVPFRSY